MTTNPLRGWMVAAVGTVLVVAYAAVATVQILVWNPQAAVPGMPLAEIWSTVRSSQGGMDHVTVPVLLAVGPLLAVVLFVLALFPLRHRPGRVALGYLALLVLGAPAYFVASFLPGMNLADTFGIGGADHAPWAQPLFAVSLAALGALAVGGVAAAVVGAKRRSPVRRA